MLGYLDRGDDPPIFFNGMIKNSQVDAQFTQADGAIKGGLSSDSSTASGTYFVVRSGHPEIPPTQGAWKVSKW